MMVFVQIYMLLHFEQFILQKTTFIFCLIALQTFLSLNPRGLHSRFVTEELRRNFAKVIAINFVVSCVKMKMVLSFNKSIFNY